MKTHSLQRCLSPREEELLTLKHRRTELDRAIRLLEEIMLIRLKRTPELTTFISRFGRNRLTPRAGRARAHSLPSIKTTATLHNVLYLDCI